MPDELKIKPSNTLVYRSFIMKVLAHCSLQLSHICLVLVVGFAHSNLLLRVVFVTLSHLMLFNNVSPWYFWVWDRIIFNFSHDFSTFFFFLLLLCFNGQSFRRFELELLLFLDTALFQFCFGCGCLWRKEFRSKSLYQFILTEDPLFQLLLRLWFIWRDIIGSYPA